MLKVILAFLIVPFLLLSIPTTADAAPKSKAPAVSASIAKNKRTVGVTFSNLANVKSIKYKLTYNSNKGAQGAQGTIKVAKKSKSLSRSLTLGTCSNKVCSYHTNIKNAKLTIDFTTTSGGVVSFEKKL